jgi:hypothetical protein
MIRYMFSDDDELIDVRRETRRERLRDLPVLPIDPGLDAWLRRQFGVAEQASGSVAEQAFAPAPAESPSQLNPDADEAA